eukprot:CAMPEP_0176121978 /NCGR_PEP_ID=MMETSP0120_2-20121206/61416_1 /TAXON_ID=160619 /ORGANISM="Kryptoperidinium foliaceum, Strain CCMP 1326" /LENGTH=118 /DNA_ID=CAMNT_0017456565 /DNA_START=116 /DNA_END=468 /DNA_ORIENTATION=-
MAFTSSIAKRPAGSMHNILSSKVSKSWPVSSLRQIGEASGRNLEFKRFTTCPGSWNAARIRSANRATWSFAASEIPLAVNAKGLLDHADAAQHFQVEYAETPNIGAHAVVRLFERDLR